MPLDKQEIIKSIGNSWEFDNLKDILDAGLIIRHIMKVNHISLEASLDIIREAIIAKLNI